MSRFVKLPNAIYGTELTDYPSRYTLAEMRLLASNYCDEWERETESTQTEFRLMLSLMFEWLARKEREGR